MDGKLAARPGQDAATTSHIDADPGDRSLLLRSFVVPGLTYPVWHLLTPPDAVDPFAVWLALGLAFLAVPIVHLLRPLSREALQNVMSGLAACVTLHLFALSALNETASFYAVGGALAVLATALFIRSTGLLVAYSVLAISVGGSVLLLAPDETRAAYWGGTIPVLFFAYYRLKVQLAQRRELEETVRERTQQLTEANRRLRNEAEERTRLENELRTTHKMEAVGRLAGGVAHDFNNLLTTIGVYAELLLDGLPEDSPLRGEVRQIQKANAQASSLTQQLLTLGRRSHVRVELLDLNEVVADAGALLRHLLGPETELVLRLDESPQPVLANVDQLQQILINLAINARDAMSGAGRFTIETARRTSREVAALDAPRSPQTPEALDAPEYVLLSVADTGSGMSAEARDRAFDPFFTTKQPDRGAGLGLSIVHGIVSQANGHVRLESELGKGTRLDIFWPVGRPQSKGTELPRTALRAPGRNEDVLLVEDEEDVRVALHRVLVSSGYRVTTADSAESALEITSRPDTSFDLVVADVVMPRMSGFELAERLEVEHPGTKLLLISGHLSDRALEHLSDRIPFLAKPFSASALSEKVRELLDQPA
jgi:signal transduction histidine kinase